MKSKSTPPSIPLSIENMITMYPIGKSIFEWDHDLEAKLRKKGMILFCGEAKLLDIIHFVSWSGENIMAGMIYQDYLKSIGDPKYIIIHQKIK